MGNDCTPPSWLDINHPSINIVNESTLYKNIQPNSETKKLYYHKIKGLTDYFFTFDDDFYLAKTINLNDYFFNRKLILYSVGYSLTKFPNLHKYSDKKRTYSTIME